MVDNDLGDGITIDNPLPGAALPAGTHELRASARDAGGITSITIGLDGDARQQQSGAGDAAAEVVWRLKVPANGSLDGDHEIKAAADLANGERLVVSRDITIDTTSPTRVEVMSITTPGDGGLVRFDVEADDEAGLAAVVLLAGSVEIDKRQAHGASFGGTMHVATEALAGAKGLRVVAIDRAGNMRATQRFALSDDAAGSGPARNAPAPNIAPEPVETPAFTAPPETPEPEADAGIVISPGPDQPAGDAATDPTDGSAADDNVVDPDLADAEDEAAADASLRAPPTRGP